MKTIPKRDKTELTIKITYFFRLFPINNSYKGIA